MYLLLREAWIKTADLGTFYILRMLLVVAHVICMNVCVYFLILVVADALQTLNVSRDMVCSFFKGANLVREN